MNVSREKIELPENMMRQTISEADLDNLVASIKDIGIINPLIVRKKGEKYELIAGLRRLMAADVLKMETIYVRVVKAGEERAEKIKVDENKAREDVSPIDEGVYYKELMEKMGWKQKQLAEKLRMSESYVSQRITAADWPELLREVVNNGQLNFSVAREFSQIKDESEMVRVIEQAITSGVSPAVAARWRHEINRDYERTEAGEAGEIGYQGIGPSGRYVGNCHVCGEPYEDENRQILTVCNKCLGVIQIGREKGVFLTEEKEKGATQGKEVE